MAIYHGQFRGVLRWPQLDDLWARIRSAPEGWYIYAVGEPPPDSKSSSEQLLHFIDEVDQLLRAEHKEDYCGIVYVDDREQPAFVKIYDPNNLGVSCGSSEFPPYPGWILSRIPPVDLPTAFPPPNNRRRWWQRLLAH
ncbi:MAG: hypothetical protein P8Y64_02000 [Gammaproteobacteria bacterium]